MNKLHTDIERYAKSLIRKLTSEGKSKNTLDAYSRTYSAFIEFCKQNNVELSLKTIKESDIYEFFEFKENNMQKQGKLAQRSKKSYVTHLGRLFKFIEKESDELLNFDKVFDDISIKIIAQKPKGLTEKETAILVEYLEQNDKDNFLVKRNHLIIKLFLYGGLRVSEGVSLCRSDIISHNEDLYKLSFTGKGDKLRYTFIEKALIQNELDYLDEYYLGQDDYRFCMSETNKVFDRTQIYRMITKILKRCGIAKSGVHVLRHTFAKNLINDGITINIVQSLLGHASLQTTSIYSNPDEESIGDALEARKNRVA